MKKFLLIALVIVSSIQILSAQHSISSNYTNNYIGHDFDLNYNYMIKKHKVIVGTSFLLNQVWQNNPSFHTFYKTFHAFNFAERFGLKLGYQYHFPLKNNKTAFFVSFDTRYRYGKTRTLTIDFDLVGPNVNYRQFPFAPYREIVSNGIHAFSNQIGGGIQTHLFSNLYLNGQVGVGIDSFIEKNYYNSAGFNLSYIASLGIEYKFLGKKKK